MDSQKEKSLQYHREGKKGKIEINPTKPISTLIDLSLAYSPGVAWPCLEIERNPADSYEYTARGNLVAVLTNGTAVLGLGNIGPEAAKPVMEGKALLFKKFADIDSFDIEIQANTVDDFVKIAKALEPTFGGINLEDIKAPECFEIEEILKREMKIPVMHDDQHGTAIITSAGMRNALEIINKKFEEIKIVVSGAGAAAISCAKMLMLFGVKQENILMTDSEGVLYEGREKISGPKAQFITQRTDVKTLAEAMKGADVFLGLSKGNILTEEMLLSMAENPIVFALANPDPEILPEIAHAVRNDVITATGRSDYANQVNNAIGFPYIFRGALDTQASEINESMKMAAAIAIADLAKEPIPDNISQIYKTTQLFFGKEYLIPKPIDTRLMTRVSMAVAKAAMDTGVARKPIQDWESYRLELEGRLKLNHGLVREIVQKAQNNPKKVVFCEGDHVKILRAAEMVAKEKIAIPVLLGEPKKIHQIMKEYAISIPHVEIIDPRSEASTQNRENFGHLLFEKRKRKGATLHESITNMYTRNYFGAMLVETGQADALITGIMKSYPNSLKPLLQVLGKESGVNTIAGMYIINTKRGPFFFADTTINREPTVQQLEEIALLVARAVKFLKRTPKIAMLSYSNFGSNPDELASRVIEATQNLNAKHPDLIVDGDIQANLALRPDLLQEFYPFSPLAESGANTFIFPNLASANIGYKLVQELSDCEAIGPVLLGLRKPAHVLQLGASVREIVNMTALAVMDAQANNQFL